MAITELLPLEVEHERGAALVSCRFVPTELDLFMYCAATWNTHRIHFDRDYARAEGYEDLVVPGPLQSARLAQMLSEFAAVHGGRLDTLSLRHHAPLLCNRSVELRADLVTVTTDPVSTILDLAVSVSTEDGAVASSGSATLICPGDLTDAVWLGAVRGRQ